MNTTTYLKATFEQVEKAIKDLQEGLNKAKRMDQCQVIEMDLDQIIHEGPWRLSIRISTPN